MRDLMHGLQNRFEPIWIVDVGRTMQREHCVVPLLEPQLFVCLKRDGTVEMRPQCVDHHVAHHVDSLRGDSLVLQIPHGGRLGGEENIRNRVGHEPIDLFGHRTVETPAIPASTCATRMPNFDAVSAAATVEFTSPTTTNRSGRCCSNSETNRRMTSAIWKTCGPEPTFKLMSGSGMCSSSKKRLTHLLVIVLPSMNDAALHLGISKRRYQRRNLHEVRTGTGDEGNFHRNSTFGTFEGRLSRPRVTRDRIYRRDCNALAMLRYSVFSVRGLFITRTSSVLTHAFAISVSLVFS